MIHRKKPVRFLDEFDASWKTRSLLVARPFMEGDVCIYHLLRTALDPIEVVLTDVVPGVRFISEKIL